MLYEKNKLTDVFAQSEANCYLKLGLLSQFFNFSNKIVQHTFLPLS